MVGSSFPHNIINKLAKWQSRFFGINHDTPLLTLKQQTQFKSGALEYLYATWYFDYDTNCYAWGPGGGIIKENTIGGGAAMDAGSAVGAIQVDADADYIQFATVIPYGYFDDGVITSLIPQLYADATGQTNGIDAVFHAAHNTTPLLTDVYEVTTDVGWFDLETATGIGDKAVEPGDVVLVTLGPDAAQTTDLFRFRWKYKWGPRLVA